MRHRILLAVLVSSLLPGLSPLSAAPLIQRGIDAFHTPADGKTAYDFANNPIPAGFFCDGSKVFTGRVAFKGLPLATGTQGALWGADTVIERLDDVRLDDKGVGATRIRFRALSLVSIAPIKTSCGAYHVYASLVGRQRVTTMKIFHTEEAGGSFAAPLAGDVRVTFIPVKKTPNAKKLEIRQRFTFPATLQPWSFSRGVKAKASGAVVVDTDGNLTPDAQLPGTSNFPAGQPPGLATANLGACTCCPYPQGHIDPVSGHEHQTTLPMCPGTANCC